MQLLYYIMLYYVILYYIILYYIILYYIILYYIILYYIILYYIILYLVAQVWSPLPWVDEQLGTQRGPALSPTEAPHCERRRLDVKSHVSVQGLAVSRSVIASTAVKIACKVNSFITTDGHPSTSAGLQVSCFVVLTVRSAATELVSKVAEPDGAQPCALVTCS